MPRFSVSPSGLLLMDARIYAPNARSEHGDLCTHISTTVRLLATLAIPRRSSFPNEIEYGPQCDPIAKSSPHNAFSVHETSLLATDLTAFYNPPHSGTTVTLYQYVFHRATTAVQWIHGNSDHY